MRKVWPGLLFPGYYVKTIQVLHPTTHFTLGRGNWPAVSGACLENVLAIAGVRSGQSHRCPFE